ncbi:ninjurin-2-like isoform X2 [Uloborus diversus]|uniref:ninjurin-2-like isoform X2 n=1 Tax=Uloborus diversus TaxID=327109 RepID=UPI002408F61D|nr:ninjurin-2-like isoform X2 [Uloborus diversus]
MDTMVSCRPYQDVIAIYDLSDLEMFETRRRRRLAEREREKNEKQRVRWSEEDETDSTDPRDPGKYLDRLIGGNEPSGKGMPGTRMLDANVYATKKTIAQGLLDVALLTANASQLKYLLQAGKEHEFYYVMMTLISLSIILQVLTGCLMILVANTNLNEVKKQRRAENLNNAITIGVFLVAILNILISALGIKNSDDLQAALVTALGTATGA